MSQFLVATLLVLATNYLNGVGTFSILLNYPLCFAPAASGSKQIRGRLERSAPLISVSATDGRMPKTQLRDLAAVVPWP